MAKVSCIIPTYNEGKRIERVLKVIYKHPLIDEIIVVDDGSIDDTKNVLSGFPDVKFIVHPKNMGKSFAILTGLKESKGEFILLIDADLLGLTVQNITDIINPIVSEKADIAISLRANAPILWRLIGIDYISGERMLRKKILEAQYDNLAKISGFGLEVFINQIIVKNKYRIKVVPWPTVHSPEKFRKYGIWRGAIDEIAMFVEVFKTVSIFAASLQIVQMRNLRVK